MSSPVKPDYPSESDESEGEDEQLTKQSKTFLSSSMDEDGANSSRNQNESSSNETDWSFVGKIRDNVTNLFSKLIRNAKDRFGTSNHKRSNEYTGSGIQSAKRRRLYDNEEDSYFPHDRSGVRLSDSTRIDQASQTNHPYEHNAGILRRENSTPASPVFEHASADRGQGESNVFLPSISHHSTQLDELAEQQVEEADGAEDVENQLLLFKKEQELYNLEPFDPFKYLAKIDNAPVDPKRRITTFLGNRCYRKRQQRLRRGVIGRLFFVSHHKPTKNLDTSRNESNASSHRPAFNMAAYRASCDKRIPPELGGSPFYNGFTRYGGASAANTLRDRFTVAPSTPGHDRSVLVSKKKGSDKESNGLAVSSIAQRILDILEECDVAKRDGKNLLDLPDNKSISHELNQLINGPLMSCSAAVPQMLQLLRQQNIASVLGEREENTPYPPIKPLNIIPLHVDQHTSTTERRNIKAFAENRTVALETRTNLEPVVESNVKAKESVQRTTVQHIENDVMPPTSDVTDPPSPVIKNTAQADTLPTNIEEPEPAQTTDKAVNTPTAGIPLCFADPIVFADNNQESERYRENMQTFTFAEPQRLDNQDQPTLPATFSHQLMAETANRWVCTATKNGEAIENKNKTRSVSPFRSMHNLKDTFKSLVEQQKTSTWLCDGCEAPNSVELDRCLCCEQTKPNGAQSVMPHLGPSSITPNATAASSNSTSTTDTIQEPQPCSFASFKTHPTTGLPSLGNNIFTKAQPNMPFKFEFGASTTNSTFGASTTATRPEQSNHTTAVSGEKLFTSAFDTNPSNANANNNTVNFGCGNSNDGTFKMFSIPQQPPANILSSSTSTSAAICPEYQRMQTDVQAVEGPGRHQTVASTSSQPIEWGNSNDVELFNMLLESGWFHVDPLVRECINLEPVANDFDTIEGELAAEYRELLELLGREPNLLDTSDIPTEEEQEVLHPLPSASYNTRRGDVTLSEGLTIHTSGRSEDPNRLVNLVHPGNADRVINPALHGNPGRAELLRILGFSEDTDLLELAEIRRISDTPDGSENSGSTENLGRAENPEPAENPGLVENPLREENPQRFEYPRRNEFLHLLGNRRHRRNAFGRPNRLLPWNPLRNRNVNRIGIPGNVRNLERQQQLQNNVIPPPQYHPAHSALVPIGIPFPRPPPVQPRPTNERTEEDYILDQQITLDNMRDAPRTSNTFKFPLFMKRTFMREREYVE